MATTVRQLLEGKPNIFWVTPEASVYEALLLMAERNVGALLVLEGGSIRGIFSERDYARKVILLGKSSKDTRVSEIMTSKVVCVEPSWTMDQCMALMTEKRVRHLPVVERERLVGVVSIGDVVRAVVEEQATTIRHLQAYITSGA